MHADDDVTHRRVLLRAVRSEQDDVLLHVERAIVDCLGRLGIQIGRLSPHLSAALPRALIRA